MYVLGVSVFYGSGIVHLRSPGPGEEGFTYTADINKAETFKTSHLALDYVQGKVASYGIKPGLFLVKVEETRTIKRSKII